MPSCQLISATSGRRHALSDLYFPSLVDLKQFTSDTFQIPVDDILLLLPYGIILKKSRWDSKMLHDDITTIYVFDRGLFNKEVKLPPSFQLFKPLPSPLTDSNIDKNAIFRNLGWLKALQVDVQSFQDVISDTKNEITSLLECGKVILEYLKVYCYEVESLYNSNVDFLNKLHQDGVSKDWKLFYDTVLSNIKVENHSLSALFDYNDLIDLENSIRHLDQDLNKRLKALKVNIDACYDVRTSLIKSFETTTKISASTPDEMDRQMLQKFDEMALEIETVTNIAKDVEIDQDFISKFKILKDVTVPNLQTISQSLYNKADDILTAKSAIQKGLQELYISVAKAQLDVIGVKSSLSKEINRDMKVLQSYELQLSQVVDMPMCYGLYLIELYRQQLWTDEFNSLKQRHDSSLQNIYDEEMRQRGYWFKDFHWISNLLDLGHKLPSRIPSTDLENNEDVKLSEIQSYIDQLASLKVGESAIDVLKSKLLQSQKLTVGQPAYSDTSKSSDVIIQGYKSHIQKLENLLLDAQFHQYNDWPSGIINKDMAMIQRFRSNTINSKMNSSVMNDFTSTKSYLPTRKDSEEIQTLRTELSKANALSDSLRKDLSMLKGELSNAEVEKNAYKESMNNLNRELSKLLIERESYLSEMNNRKESFKKHLSSLFEQNEATMIDLLTWKQKCNDLDKMKGDLLANMANQEKQIENERLSWQTEADALKKEILHLKSLNSELERAHQVVGVNKRLEKALYDVFQSSIFILESIGLLLSKDSDNNFKIVRVKGLRKDTDSSVIDMNGSMVKSIVSQEIKSTFDTIKDDKESNTHDHFLAYTERLFGNQLFEASVIRRFNDIESLAKKLRKENKCKKILLERYNQDKITIDNFQLGDLALFLPINDQELLLNSSTSSLNSSFSSIDLNSSTASVVPRSSNAKSDVPANNLNSTQHTITDVGNISNHARSSNTYNTGYNNSTFENSNVNNPKTQNSNKKSSIWAVFTATNSNTRYILRNSASNYDVLKEKEWVMGRITAMEKHLVTENSHNPFKFPKHTIWYEVDAFFTLN